MDEESKSKGLGMECAVTRRDFLNGVAIGVGGSFLGAAVRPEDLLAAGVLDDFAPEKAGVYYPPARLGMRGNHDGTYTYAQNTMTLLSWVAASADSQRRTSFANMPVRARGFRSRQGHCRHHREPLGARLRVHSKLPIRP
jgi:hypothetical protein